MGDDRPRAPRLNRKLPRRLSEGSPAVLAVPRIELSASDIRLAAEALARCRHEGKNNSEEEKRNNSEAIEKNAIGFEAPRLSYVGGTSCKSHLIAIFRMGKEIKSRCWRRALDVREPQPANPHAAA
jgi:hypothetical protein